MSLTTLLLLSGCSLIPSSALEKADKLAVPDVRTYTDAEYDQAAQEMTDHCTLVPMLCRMINNYGVMRDQARVALGLAVDVAR